MDIRVVQPKASELDSLYDQLSRWQQNPWGGQLHPGDLGWRSTVGVEKLAADLRVWRAQDAVVAIGMFDDENLIRLALAPKVIHDEPIAQNIANDLENPSAGVFNGASAIVEARQAPALSATLRQRGWCDDDEWVPLIRDLNHSVSPDPVDDVGLSIQVAGPDQVVEWADVHWSAFKGAPGEPDVQERYRARVRAAWAGAYGQEAQFLIARDPGGVAVAVVAVWCAGAGRPGLVEPMGVHREYRGRGYGRAVTVAAAGALAERGASHAVVVAQTSETAAVATYQSAGFVPQNPVADLKWVWSTGH